MMADAPKIISSESMRTAFPKINQAIDNSNEAKKTSNEANVTAAQAVTTSNQANAKSDDTQTQLNNVIIESGTSDAEVIQARGGSPVLNERLNGVDAQLADILVNIKLFGAKADGVTDDTQAILDAVNSDAKIVYIPPGDYLIKFIPLKSDRKLIVSGNLLHESTQTGNMFYADGLNNITIFGRGGSVQGNNNTTSNFFKSLNSNNIKIQCMSLDGFLNKGIDIGENCYDVIVAKNNIKNSNGSTGAGISVLGQNTNNVIVSQNVVKNSRIGISINGGYRHIISNNVCKDNRISGISLDGIVTNSGDGVKDSIVYGNSVDGCTGTTYGGIYLGNGARTNIIANNISNNNARSGIRISGDTENKLLNNNLIGNTVKGNTNHGIEASYCEQGNISNNISVNNTLRGMSFYISDDNIISNNQVLNNGK